MVRTNAPDLPPLQPALRIARGCFLGSYFLLAFVRARRPCDRDRARTGTWSAAVVTRLGHTGSVISSRIVGTRELSAIDFARHQNPARHRRWRQHQRPFAGRLEHDYGLLLVLQGNNSGARHELCRRRVGRPLAVRLTIPPQDSLHPHPAPTCPRQYPLPQPSMLRGDDPAAFNVKWHQAAG